ncbi:MAG: hypothetical protein AAF193_03110 [Bacteroidota bacterium]
MRLAHWYVLSVLMISLSACETDPPQDTPPENSILESVGGGDVRGSSIGDQIEEVLRRESENVVHNMPDEITCRIPLNMKDSTYYDITYNFNEQGLYVIELDIFPKSEADTKALFGEFKKYYDQRYGKSSAEDGFTTWFAQSHQGTDVEITMIDESKEMNKPYLAVSFYEHSVND